MATVPKDIQDGIKQLSEKKSIPVKSLVDRLKQIKETDETIQSMEKDDFKIRYAWAILLREHSLSRQSDDFYIMPICKPRANERTIKGEPTWVGDMAALVQSIKTDEEEKVSLGEIQYAAGTFWRDAAKNLIDLVEGQVYKTSLEATENSWGITISSNNTGFVKVKHKFPTFDEFFKKEIEPKIDMTELKDLDLNVSETTTDVKVIEATVMDSVVADKDGHEYGRYLVMDNSVMGANQAIFVAPEDVIWEQGSVLKFGGTIAIDKNTSQPRWTNHFIIPTDLSLKKEATVINIKAEEVEINLDEPTTPEKTTETITKDDVVTVKAEDLVQTKEKKKETKVKEQEDENLFEV